MNQNIRLMIVDDEALMRERFRYGFSLDEQGYEIVGEAQDGEEALSLCDKIHTDIVITDIVMPRLDGLELTRRLKEKIPRIKVILLSNYREFEFARKAIALGAMGYMLKVKLNRQELLSMLDQARKEIERERAQLIEEINARHRKQKLIPILRKQLFAELLQQNNLHNLEIMDYFAHLGLHLPSFAMSVTLVQIDHYSVFRKTFHHRDVFLFQYALMQIAEEVANEACRSNAIFWNEKELLLIMHWDEASWQQEENSRLIDNVLQGIARAVQRFLPFSVSIGASGIRAHHTASASLEFLKESLQLTMKEARWALKKRFYTGHQCINIYSQDDRYSQPDPDWKQHLHNFISSTNPAMNETLLKRHIREQIGERIEKERFDPEQVIESAEQILENCYKHDSATRRFQSEKLKTVETVHDFERFIFELILYRQTAQQLPCPEMGCHKVVDQALRYIAGHYHLPLSITDICEQVKVTPNYFSYIFKKTTGINFTDYLTGYRMQQASRLLLETTLHVKEIAEKVGIPDYKYFTQLFRRTIGYTPSDFRKEHSSANTSDQQI